MMKIAIASMGSQVADHFGHCESFRIFATDNGAIESETCINNPGHKPGFLPNFLADMGAEVIIAGGMGG
ncbi:MAG: dinitrogenase iron-molybdenum cofactor, partial [Eubacteriales bacterium]|nr:dinitrogenase iron-molybdenum cofactor [Eubacteriales bacterium]